MSQGVIQPLPGISEPAAAEAPADSLLGGASLKSGAVRLFDANTPACDVAIEELRRLLALWRRHETGARRGSDPEELHQLRVTVRRIDAMLGLFRHELPPALVRARRTTKAVLRSLGATRDLDVELMELDRFCADLSGHERAAAEPLRVHLERQRTRAHARMVRALDSEPTRHWLETLTLATASPPMTQGGERVGAVMSARVRQRFRKLRKAVGRLRAKSSMEEYHAVRRRAKRLRYATECGAPLFGKSGEELLRALRRMQDRLGVHQDAYIAQSRLAALAADPATELPSETLFLMGRLAEHHAGGTTAARETLRRTWRKVDGKRWKALRAILEDLGADSAGDPPAAPAFAPEVAGPPAADRTAEPDIPLLRH